MAFANILPIAFLGLVALCSFVVPMSPYHSGSHPQAHSPFRRHGHHKRHHHHHHVAIFNTDNTTNTQSFLFAHPPNAAPPDNSMWTPGQVTAENFTDNSNIYWRAQFVRSMDGPSPTFFSFVSKNVNASYNQVSSRWDSTYNHAEMNFWSLVAVPPGPNTFLLVNMYSTNCLSNQGRGQAVTEVACNITAPAAPNQVWSFKPKHHRRK